MRQPRHASSNRGSNYQDSRDNLPDAIEDTCLDPATYVGRTFKLAHTNASFKVLKADAANVHIQLVRTFRPSNRTVILDPSNDKPDAPPIELITLCEFGRWVASGYVELPEITRDITSEVTTHEPEKPLSLPSQLPSQGLLTRAQSTADTHRYPSVRRFDTNKPISTPGV